MCGLPLSRGVRRRVVEAGRRPPSYLLAVRLLERSIQHPPRRRSRGSQGAGEERNKLRTRSFLSHACFVFFWGASDPPALRSRLAAQGQQAICRRAGVVIHYLKGSLGVARCDNQLEEGCEKGDSRHNHAAVPEAGKDRRGHLWCRLQGVCVCVFARAFARIEAVVSTEFIRPV